MSLDFLPAFTDTRPGVHQITLRAGDEQRQAQFALTEPSGLAITIIDGHVVVRGGSPGAELSVLTIGPRGPERLARTFDATGTWRSPLSVAEAAPLRIFAQSGDAWASIGSASTSRTNAP